MNNIKSIKPYFIILIALTLLTSVFLGISFSLSLDTKTGFFKADSIYASTFSILYALGLLVCLAGTLLFPRKSIVKSDNSLGNTSKIVLALLGTATILFGTFFCLMTSNVYLIDGISYMYSVGIYAFGGYLLLLSVKDGYSFSNLKLLCLLVSIAFPATIHLINNSDFVKPLSAPDNVLSSIFGVGFLVYIIYEGNRLHSGEHHRMHFASMLFTIFTGFTISSAYIVVFLLGSVNDAGKFYQTIGIFVVCIAILVKTIIFINHAIAHTEEEWAEIEATQEQVQENQLMVEENANETKEV